MRPIRWLRRGMLLAGMGVAGGALIVTARHLLETPQPLRSVLGGDAHIDRKHGGDIYYNVAGVEAADPVVLLHDFYPGASNFEYRHLFPRLAATWRVYAPDWLGFGMSEHPALAYTGEFYANMLLGLLRDVVGRPAVVVGHGRAANIAARAAADGPELFAQLVLVSPDVEAGIQLEPKPAQLLARATQRVSLGLVPYALLSTKPLLRRLARSRSAQTGGAIGTEESLDHLYASAHQFGGQHALLALMTGELDLPIQHLFPLLQPPVLLISGGEDHEHSPEAMEDLAVLNPHADLDVLPGAGDTAFE
ncbi:MAG TPA: alpha/beta fold hydrolase, partial [Xanthobacteraceae bacterium]|nr:alpha/beta fold hydrolase [Xanthobacteraceae bacterium]